jgi:hypothetical protein
MLGLTQRIAFTAVPLIGVVLKAKHKTAMPLFSETTRIVRQESIIQVFGHCENRRAEGLTSCSQDGVYVPPGASRKDQCLNRVEAEYRACGYRSVCTTRWLQGLQACN